MKLSIRQKLKSGKALLGTWAVIPSPVVAEIMAQAGFDFIIIDMEHGPSSFETAQAMVQSSTSDNFDALVRVPTNDASIILRALEIGSAGVVVPQITTGAEAKSVVQSSKYFPIGARGLSPYTRSAGYAAENVTKHTEDANEQTAVVVLVEGIEGIRNIDSIAQNDGIDVVYLGIYDLSQSVGHPGNIRHPKVITYLEECVSKICSYGKAVGCLATSQEDVKRYTDLGVQFVAYEADSALLMRQCRNVRLAFDSNR